MTAEHERVNTRSMSAAPEAGAMRDEFAVPSQEEIAIPVVAEELRVGKREVERGGHW